MADELTSEDVDNINIEALLQQDDPPVAEPPLGQPDSHDTVPQPQTQETPQQQQQQQQQQQPHDVGHKAEEVLDPKPDPDPDDTNAEASHLINLATPSGEIPEDECWTTHVVFTCYICNREISGFRESLAHMRDEHPEPMGSNETKCIVCPKVFGRRDHLKKHIFRHVKQVHPDLEMHPKTYKTRVDSDDDEEDEDYLDDENSSKISSAILEGDEDAMLAMQIRLKMDFNDFPAGTDWSSQTYFNCYICGSEVDGFRDGVEHVRYSHADTLTRDKNCPCVVCPKLFARMDHLKKHVWSHVNRVIPGIPSHFIQTPGYGESYYKRSKRLKEEAEEMEAMIGDDGDAVRFKMDPDDFPDGVDWSTMVYLSCYLCQAECDGFREGVKHIRTAHPETLVEDKASPCMLCSKRFARMDHLKNHVYSHVNKASPNGVPRHNISTFVR